MHVKQGDEVVIISGRNKGQSGRVREALPKKERVVVENVNIIKKHVKSMGNRQGGIIEVEAPIHVSNVLLYCPTCKKGVRTGHVFNDEGKKVRYCKICKTHLD